MHIKAIFCSILREMDLGVIIFTASLDNCSTLGSVQAMIENHKKKKKKINAVL